MNSSYRIFPFEFEKFQDGDYLLVGMAGDFIFLSPQEFKSFYNHQLEFNSDCYNNLKSKNFLSDSKEGLVNSIDMTATRYRTKKGFLKEFTTLHMMVITVRCNQKCKYCQVSCEEEDASKFDMQPETAKRIVDFIFQSPSPSIKIEFQGGEPLLNFDTIKTTVLYAEEKKKKIQKNVEFVICTNLTSAHVQDKLDFIREHGILISSSLDGTQEVHDACRVDKSGQGTYQKFVSNLGKCREICGEESVDALMTTSAYSLEHIREIIDEYIRLGFHGIFLRAINPYGFAEDNKKELGYPVDAFIEMYKEALSYILELNKQGFYFVEHYTTLLLRRILTPYPTGFVDLQSPSGAGIQGVIYDFDGSIFPADEGRMLSRMGDNYFLMGNVYNDSYIDVFNGGLLRNIVNNSCLEIMPSCSQCVFSAYCGADPIRNYLETGQIIGDRRNSDFCRKNKAIFKHLFSLIKQNDSRIMDILWSWINGRAIDEIDNENN